MEIRALAARRRERRSARRRGRWAHRDAQGPHRPRQQGRAQASLPSSALAVPVSSKKTAHRPRRAESAGQLGKQPLQSAGSSGTRRFPRSATHETTIMMHNDAVVQGLSELPFMSESTVGEFLRSAPGSATPASPTERHRARIDDPIPAATIRKNAAGRTGLKPAPFAYARARSVAHAIELLGEDEARLLAGGQSLIATLNMRLDRPCLLIDINAIPGTRSYRPER